MNKSNHVRAISLTVLAASLAAAFGPAAAEDDEITRLIRPESSVQLGAGYLTDDAIRYGQYTGLKSTGWYAIGGVDYVRRGDQTGTWYRLRGRNLGLESRELRVEHERQGDWGYGVEYSKTPRFSQYVVNTGLQGIGHDLQTVTVPPIAAGTGFDKRLKTEREAVTLAGQKFLGNGLDLQVRFKNETKEGDRLFGRGAFSGGTQFLAEPIDHMMRQLDVILGYTGERLQLSGGYYGSFFENDHSALTVSPFVAGASVQALSPMALPPDNHAHQFYLTGGYSFTPTTRGNLKVARTVAYQRDSFVVPSTTGRSNLGGRVETTLAQLGLSARPMPKLSLLANLKYEDRDDQTPERQYFTPPASGTFSGFNEPRSLRSTTGKIEASYLLPADFRATGGVDYEAKRRNTFPLRLTTFRKETEETAYRVELRRALSETVNGSVALVYSERTGSSFDSFPAAVVRPAGPVAPVHLADRDREKVRLKLDWAPLDPLSVQLLADFSRDDYSGGNLGLEDGSAAFWSIDASYNFTDEWQGLAWVSRDYSRVLNKTSGSGGSLANQWQANLRLLTEAFGLGVRGSLGSSWKIGGDLQYSRDRSDFGLSGNPVVAELADVKYSLATLKLFAEYEMKRDLALRFDLVHDRWSTNDWLWEGTSQPFTYTDGTTLSQDTTQEASFVGVSMKYTWR